MRKKIFPQLKIMSFIYRTDQLEMINKWAYISKKSKSSVVRDAIDAYIKKVFKDAEVNI